MKTLDCRGLACPVPVIQVKKTLEETPPGESFSIHLDSEVSRDNVLRFVKSKGAGVRTEVTENSGIRLLITAPPPMDPEAAGQGIAQRKAPVVLITSEVMGSGDDKLGRILMEGFLNALLDQEHIPDRILFLNAGVRLAVKGSAVLDALNRLTDMGCEIKVCGTCLDFFGLIDQLAVGTVSNMYEIQGNLLDAGSVIRA